MPVQREKWMSVVGDSEYVLVRAAAECEVVKEDA
jgi:hypothetical protein